MSALLNLESILQISSVQTGQETDVIFLGCPSKLWPGSPHPGRVNSNANYDVNFWILHVAIYHAIPDFFKGETCFVCSRAFSISRHVLAALFGTKQHCWPINYHYPDIE